MRTSSGTSGLPNRAGRARIAERRCRIRGHFASIVEQDYNLSLMFFDKNGILDIDGMLEENESFRKVMEDGIVTEDEIKSLSDNVVSVLHDIEARFSDEQQAEVRSLMVEACALFAAWHYHSVQSLNNE